jgi:type IV pilus assembly protein PilM
VRLGGAGIPAPLAGFAVEPLPPAAVVPALNASNVTDPSTVVEALRRAVERAGGRTGRAALVVPDTVAKVSLLRFEQVPARAADLAELIRWQVRKAVPFPIADAQITWVPGAPSVRGREFVVTIARRDIVQEYEAVVRAAGLQPGVVDVATFNLVNAALATGPAPVSDWLVVHLAGDYLTLVVLRGEAVIFYRHRGAGDDGSLADVVHQTAMYYEDRLRGTGFSRVVLTGPGSASLVDRVDTPQAETEAVRRELEQRLRARVELLDPRSAVTFTDRIAATPALLDTIAPIVGLLAREGAA